MTGAEFVVTVATSAGTVLAVYGLGYAGTAGALALRDSLINRRPTSEPLCLVMDESDDPGDPHGVCNLPAGHPGVIHAEWRDGKLWAQWRSILPGDESIRWGGGDRGPR